MKLSPAQEALLAALADGEYHDSGALAAAAQVQRKWANKLLMRLADDGVLEMSRPVHNAAPMFRLSRGDASPKLACKGLVSRVHRVEDTRISTTPHDHIGTRFSCAWVQTNGSNYG